VRLRASTDLIVIMSGCLQDLLPVNGKMRRLSADGRRAAVFCLLPCVSVVVVEGSPEAQCGFIAIPTS
jgi:hypothetical protein